MDETCGVCGSTRGVDRHHVQHRGMGGSREAAVHDEANLLTLCRACHTKVHEGPWRLVRTVEGVEVLDRASGRRVMRRLANPGVDVPALLYSLTEAEASFGRLVEAVPYFSDEQLLAAFASATAFGKRAWLVRAAILREAPARSVYGDRTLEAVARRFEISLRQAEKYALVWQTFFGGADPAAGADDARPRDPASESVNIDEIVLDEPSWYVVAATESPDPAAWLVYAQDRKLEDPRYSVAAFRRDIRASRRRAEVPPEPASSAPPDDARARGCNARG